MLRIGLRYRIKANSLHMEPGPMAGVSFVEVFLMDPSLRQFQRKSQKTLNDLNDKLKDFQENSKSSNTIAFN